MSKFLSGNLRAECDQVQQQQQQEEEQRKDKNINEILKSKSQKHRRIKKIFKDIGVRLVLSKHLIRLGADLPIKRNIHKRNAICAECKRHRCVCLWATTTTTQILKHNKMGTADTSNEWEQRCMLMKDLSSNMTKYARTMNAMLTERPVSWILRPRKYMYESSTNLLDELAKIAAQQQQIEQEKNLGAASKAQNRNALRTGKKAANVNSSSKAMTVDCATASSKLHANKQLKLSNANINKKPSRLSNKTISSMQKVEKTVGRVSSRVEQHKLASAVNINNVKLITGQSKLNSKHHEQQQQQQKATAATATPFVRRFAAEVNAKHYDNNKNSNSTSNNNAGSIDANSQYNLNLKPAKTFLQFAQNAKQPIKTDLQQSKRKKLRGKRLRQNSNRLKGGESSADEPSETPQKQLKFGSKTDAATTAIKSILKSEDIKIYRAETETIRTSIDANSVQATAARLRRYPLALPIPKHVSGSKLIRSDKKTQDDPAKMQLIYANPAMSNTNAIVDKFDSTQSIVIVEQKRLDADKEQSTHAAIDALTKSQKLIQPTATSTSNASTKTAATKTIASLTQAASRARSNIKSTVTIMNEDITISYHKPVRFAASKAKKPLPRNIN